MEIKLRIIYPLVKVDMKDMVAYSKLLKKHDYFPLNKLLDDEDGFVNCSSWDNMNKDMKDLSYNLENLVFCLDIIYSDKVGTKFYKNGEYYEEKGEITFPQFDSAKLK